VKEEFAFHIPDNLDLDKAAPLLCAGATTYSPLVHFRAREMGEKFSVGILGLGGLGHLAAKFSQSFGNQVTVISRTVAKKGFADDHKMDFLCSGNSSDMKKAASTLNLIIATASANFDIRPYLKLLKTDGVFCLVGLPSDNLQFHAFDVIGGRISVTGSAVAGNREIQEMLDYCGEKKIFFADTRLLAAKDVNHVMVELHDSQHPERFVIKIAETLVDGDWEVEDDKKIDPSSWNVLATIKDGTRFHRSHKRGASGPSKHSKPIESRHHHSDAGRSGRFVAFAIALAIGSTVGYFIGKKHRH